jgi:hypothetical protein
MSDELDELMTNEGTPNSMGEEDETMVDEADGGVGMTLTKTRVFRASSSRFGTLMPWSRICSTTMTKSKVKVEISNP